MMNDNLDYLLNTLVLAGEVWDEREGKHFLGKRALAEITRLRADNVALVKERDEALKRYGECVDEKTEERHNYVFAANERDAAYEALRVAREALTPLERMRAYWIPGKHELEDDPFPAHGLRVQDIRQACAALAAIDALLKEGGE